MIIDIYFYKTFSTQTSSISILKTFLDTMSDILDKCLCFSLIKIEPVSIFPSQATLGPILSSVVYTFRLKMLLLVLIKNCNSFVYLIWILSNKLDLNQETRFTIISLDSNRSWQIWAPYFSSGRGTVIHQYLNTLIFSRPKLNLKLAPSFED